MEYIENAEPVKTFIARIQQENSETAMEKLKPMAHKIGQILGKMHVANIVHGDLTTSNMLLRGDPDKLDVVLIDFGLSFFDNVAEEKGVDLYVLERALLSTHPNTEEVFECMLTAYKQTNKSGAQEVIKKLDEVRLRGRKRTMVG